MLRRLVLCSSAAVALTLALGAAPAFATHQADCVFVAAVDQPPPGPSAGDYTVFLPATIPSSAVGTWFSVTNALGGSIVATSPPGSTVAIVNTCSVIPFP